MELARLGTAQLAGLLAALWAATLALHLLQVRRRRVVVPSTQLWDELLAPNPTARLFSRLRQRLSLLLALAIVSLLGLSFADPHLRTLADAHTRVVLIDAGLSMQARDIAPSRLQAALQSAHRLIDARAPRDRISIVQMDDGALPLCSFSDQASTLHAAVTAVRASPEHTRFAPAAHLALEMLQSQPNAELIILSDGAYVAAPELLARLHAAKIRVAQQRFGTRSQNLRISALAVRRYVLRRDQAEILVEVENGGTQPQAATLQLMSNGATLLNEALSIPAGGRVRRVYENLGGTRESLEARITASAGDDLPADDAASVHVPAPHPRRVLLVTAGNRYLEAASLLDDALDVDTLTPAQYTTGRGYSVVVFDRFAPAQPPEAPALYFAPPAGALLPAAVRGEVTRPFFDRIEREHPLLRHVVLDDVNVARAQRLVLAPQDHVVASSTEAPLISTGQRAGMPFIAFSFDLRESDLPLRVAWPLLLLNALDYLDPAPSDGPVSADIAGPTADLSPHTIPQAMPAAVSGSPRDHLQLPAELWLPLTALALLLLSLEWLGYQRKWTA